MNINALIRHFFEENDFNKIVENLTVVRADGITIYSNNPKGNDSYSVGALVGGLWQAAEALTSFTKKVNDVFEFRLSFDTTDSGIYVIPLKINNGTYMVSALYTEVLNPAHLKQKLRNLCNSLELFLNDSISIQEQQRSDYLFNDISDKEMDNLFNFLKV